MPKLVCAAGSQQAQNLTNICPHLLRSGLYRHDLCLERLVERGRGKGRLEMLVERGRGRARLQRLNLSSHLLAGLVVSSHRLAVQNSRAATNTCEKVTLQRVPLVGAGES